MDIPITFRTRCYECGEEILPGRAFWSESKKSAKHLRRGASKSQIDDKTPVESLDSKWEIMGNSYTSLDIELNCFVCGKTAGCRTCSYSTTCDRRIVSQLCICETCLNPKDKKDAFERVNRCNHAGWLRHMSYSICCSLHLIRILDSR